MWIPRFDGEDLPMMMDGMSTVKLDNICNFKLTYSSKWNNFTFVSKIQLHGGFKVIFEDCENCF